MSSHAVPAWAADRRPDRFTLLIVLVALLGAAHILIRTSTYGASLDYAFNYLSAAESLAAGEGLLSPGGGIVAIVAPFFSMAMAFLSLFGLEPIDGGRFLNATAFGLLIGASGLWLSRRLESRPIALGVAVAVMASVPVAHSASTLISEPLFILFTLLALMPLESFLNRRSGAPALMLSAVFAALAALTRYMGAALIISGVLILLARRNVPVRQRLKHALAFGAISSLPLAGVMVRNQLVSGALFGIRTEAAGQGPSGQSLFDSLGQIVEVFQQWADPLFLIHWQLQHSPWLIACLSLLLAALLLVTPRLSRASSGSSVFWIFALIYLAIIAVVAPLTVGAKIDSRYLLPIYVPLLFVAAFWLDALLRGKLSGRMSAFRWALVALALVGGAWHIGVSVQQNLRLTAEALESGYIGKSLNTAYWEDSELVAYVRAKPRLRPVLQQRSQRTPMERGRSGNAGDLGAGAAAEPGEHVPALVRAGRPGLPAVRRTRRACRMGQRARTRRDNLHPLRHGSAAPVGAGGGTGATAPSSE